MFISFKKDILGICLSGHKKSRHHGYDCRPIQKYLNYFTSFLTLLAVRCPGK